MSIISVIDALALTERILAHKEDPEHNPPVSIEEAKAAIMVLRGSRTAAATAAAKTKKAPRKKSTLNDLLSDGLS